jgi:hypothetical protein
MNKSYSVQGFIFIAICLCFFLPVYFNNSRRVKRRYHSLIPSNSGQKAHRSLLPYF